MMRNITNEIAAAESALADAEARAAALETERIARLEADVDYVITTAQLTRELEALHETAQAHRARIAVLLEKQKQAAREQRERQRIAAIAKIRKSLSGRVTTAAALDQALVAVAKAVSALEAADRAVFAGWPSVLPTAHSLRYTSTLNGAALSTVRRQHPAAPGILRSLVEKMHTFDFAAEAEQANADLISELDRSPVVEAEAAA
jgi:hypothetical protein